jgi:hypothetical protein
MMSLFEHLGEQLHNNFSKTKEVQMGMMAVCTLGAAMTCILLAFVPGGGLDEGNGKRNE